MLNIQTAFLVDSGSTATLVSARVFQSIQPDKRPLLVKLTDKVRGANGGDIEVLGIADIQLKLGGVCFCQTAIVCDILPDGILGQDFTIVEYFTDRSKAVLLLWIFYVFVLSCVCYVLCASVYMCFVVTCWEWADLLALVCGVFCEFVTFPLVSWVRCGT